MAEPPLKPVLQKPPGYKDPNIPAEQSGFRPPPRRALLPPSLHQREEKSRFCRVCCCSLCIFFSILILLIVTGCMVFYILFNPKFPVFHVQSIRMSQFNITKRPDGTYLDATTTTRLEVKNPNLKMTFNFGDTELDVSFGEGGGEAAAGTTAVTGSTGETELDEIRTGHQNKTFPVIVKAQTKVGLGVAGLKIGKMAVTVKCCDGITVKQLDGGDMPKCVNMLKW
ncbi:3'-5'-exoribonuclease family protein isoform 1 [Hibiscus syriacus]|uniref:3'-5'-exoribonuclease family protein isoform 1 n=1 Tax=Hibiscus syriacus TaxID=106335 RepID=A0A6A2Z155_HIBSY|nr:3'-5'-exoribonuclease family protein isoform 1 [Hibiscus syriacus]